MTPLLTDFFKVESWKFFAHSVDLICSTRCYDTKHFFFFPDLNFSNYQHYNISSLCPLNSLRSY